jgi:hypothetical protein
MAALIVIDDPSNPPTTGSVDRDVTFLGVQFDLSNFDDTGVLGWLWELKDKPIGSTAVLSATTTATTSIVPDVVGTYLVELKTYTDAGRTILDDVDVQGIGIRYAAGPGGFDWRVPAAGETTQFDAARGWATAREEMIRDVRNAIVVNGLQDAYDNDETITTDAQGSVDVTRGAGTVDGEGALLLTDANAVPGRTAALLSIADANVGTGDAFLASRSAANGSAGRFERAVGTERGIEVGLTTPTVTGVWFADGDLVLGGSTMSAAEKLRVVGAARIEGKLTVTGAIDPTYMEFPEQGADPGAQANAVRIYAKDVGGEAEFFVQSDSNVTQITDSGSINVGSIAFSLQDAYDDGQSIDTDANGEITITRSTGTDQAQSALQVTGDNTAPSRSAALVYILDNDTLASATVPTLWVQKNQTGPDVTIERSNNTATGPEVRFFHDRSTPTDEDETGAVRFFGEDDQVTPALTEYAKIQGVAQAVLNTSPRGRIDFEVQRSIGMRRILGLLPNQSATESGCIFLNRIAADVNDAFELRAANIHTGAVSVLKVSQNDGGTDLFDVTGAGNSVISNVSMSGRTATANVAVFRLQVDPDTGPGFPAADTAALVAGGLDALTVAHATGSNQTTVKIVSDNSGGDGSILDIGTTKSPGAPADEPGKIVFTGFSSGTPTARTFSKITCDVITSANLNERAQLELYSMYGDGATSHFPLIAQFQPATAAATSGLIIRNTGAAGTTPAFSLVASSDFAVGDGIFEVRDNETALQFEVRGSGVVYGTYGFMAGAGASANLAVWNWSGDIDTGFGRPAANTVAVVAGGLDALTVAHATGSNQTIATITSNNSAAGGTLLILDSSKTGAAADNQRIRFTGRSDTSSAYTQAEITVDVLSAANQDEDTQLEINLAAGGAAAKRLPRVLQIRAVQTDPTATGVIFRNENTDTAIDAFTFRAVGDYGSNNLFAIEDNDGDQLFDVDGSANAVVGNRFRTRRTATADTAVLQLATDTDTGPGFPAADTASFVAGGLDALTVAHAVGSNPTTVTITSDNTTVTGSLLILTSTDNGTVGDNPGVVRFSGKDSAGGAQNYCDYRARMANVTHLSEKGQFEFYAAFGDGATSHYPKIAQFFASTAVAGESGLVVRNQIAADAGTVFELRASATHTGAVDVFKVTQTDGGEELLVVGGSGTLSIPNGAFSPSGAIIHNRSVSETTPAYYNVASGVYGYGFGTSAVNIIANNLTVLKVRDGLAELVKTGTATSNDPMYDSNTLRFTMSGWRSAAEAVRSYDIYAAKPSDSPAADESDSNPSFIAIDIIGTNTNRWMELRPTVADPASSSPPGMIFHSKRTADAGYCWNFQAEAQHTGSGIVFRVEDNAVAAPVNLMQLSGSGTMTISGSYLTSTTASTVAARVYRVGGSSAYGYGFGSDTSVNIIANSLSVATFEDKLVTVANRNSAQTVGPTLKMLLNDGAAGADGEVVGALSFAGMNDNVTPAEQEMARIEGVMVDASDTTEDGLLALRCMTGGNVGRGLEIFGANASTAEQGVIFMSQLDPTTDTPFRFRTSQDGAAGEEVFAFQDANGTATLFSIEGDGNCVVGNDIEAVGGYRSYIGHWLYDNLGASQTRTDCALSDLSARATFNSVLMTRAGSITGCAAMLDSAATGSNLTINVERDAGAGFSVVYTIQVTTGNTEGTGTQAKDTDTFAAGDTIKVTFTTDGSWTATTASMNVWVECEF